jgi:hypothetical protein
VLPGEHVHPTSPYGDHEPVALAPRRDGGLAYADLAHQRELAGVRRRLTRLLQHLELELRILGRVDTVEQNLVGLADAARARLDHSFEVHQPCSLLASRTG